MVVIYCCTIHQLCVSKKMAAAIRGFIHFYSMYFDFVHPDAARVCFCSLKMFCLFQMCVFCPDVRASIFRYFIHSLVLRKMAAVSNIICAILTNSWSPKKMAAVNSFFFVLHSFLYLLYSWSIYIQLCSGCLSA